MTQVTVERAFDAADELGEGATWDLATGRLISVDIMRGRVHIFDPRTSTVRTLEVGQPVGAAAPRGKGGLVLAVRDGFATLVNGSLVEHRTFSNTSCADHGDETQESGPLLRSALDRELS